jgi:glycerophosphoryl diester phosphodiesterase
MNKLPSLIGHRGCKLAPENTLAAIRKAHELGAQAVEVDVQCSRDGQLVVCHDDRLDRTTDGHGRLTDYNWAELSQLDAGSWFSPQYKGERLPLLSQVLQTAQQLGLLVVVEIKAGARTPDFAANFLKTLDTYPSYVRVISFDRKILQELRQLRPDLPTGTLYSERPVVKGMEAGLAIGAAAGMALGHPVLGALAGVACGYLYGRNQVVRDARSQPGSVLPYWLGVDPIFTHRLKGREIIAYTADNPALERRLLRNGCAAVLTDYPGRAISS